MAAVPDIKQRILDVLNAKYSQSVTLDQVTFGVPYSNLINGVVDTANNTLVEVSAKVGASNMLGSTTVRYNRRDLDSWIAGQAPSYVYPLPAGYPGANGKTVAALASILGLGTVADLLPVLNSIYNGGFTLDDFVDGPLPTDISANPLFILPARSDSYQYTGSLAVMFYDPATLLPMSSVFPDATVGDLPPIPGSVDPGSGTAV